MCESICLRNKELLRHEKMINSKPHGWIQRKFVSIIPNRSHHPVFVAPNIPYVQTRCIPVFLGNPHFDLTNNFGTQSKILKINLQKNITSGWRMAPFSRRLWRKKKVINFGYHTKGMVFFLAKNWACLKIDVSYGTDTLEGENTGKIIQVSNCEYRKIRTWTTWGKK